MAQIPRPPFVPFTCPSHGVRDMSAIKHFVFHTTEGGGTVESLASYFRSGTYGIMYITEPTGRCGSLGDWRKLVWHVASHNTECVGLEQIGYARYSTEDWFENLHQLWAAAWIAAYCSQELSIPLVQSARARHWIAPSGFCQHRDVPDNDHTDCGPGYPFGWVLARARDWRSSGVPAFVVDELRKARAA